jgi:hypothetical protein
VQQSPHELLLLKYTTIAYCGRSCCGSCCSCQKPLTTLILPLFGTMPASAGNALLIALLNLLLLLLLLLLPQLLLPMLLAVQRSCLLLQQNTKLPLTCRLHW